MRSQVKKLSIAAISSAAVYFDHQAGMFALRFLLFWLNLPVFVASSSTHNTALIIVTSASSSL